MNGHFEQIQKNQSSMKSISLKNGFKHPILPKGCECVNQNGLFTEKITFTLVTNTHVANSSGFVMNFSDFF